MKWLVYFYLDIIRTINRIRPGLLWRQGTPRRGWIITTPRKANTRTKCHHHRRRQQKLWWRGDGSIDFTQRIFGIIEQQRRRCDDGGFGNKRFHLYVRWSIPTLFTTRTWIDIPQAYLPSTKSWDCHTYTMPMAYDLPRKVEGFTN